MGAVPFALCFLFFAADMSRGAHADARLGFSALLLTVLYVWMKFWQVAFAQTMRATLTGDQAPAWTFRRIWNVLLLNCTLQPLALVMLPICVILTFPFPFAYAFFHNLTILGDGEDPSIGSNASRAARQARMWVSSHVAFLFVMSKFVFFVFLNWFLVLMMLPMFVKTLTGVETDFSRAGWNSVLNTTYLAVVIMLTWISVSPLVRAVYTLRCFYGESLKSGADLRADLRFSRLAAKVGLILLLFGAPQSSQANEAGSENTGTKVELNEEIDRVLEKAEFSWRSPREISDSDKDGSVLGEYISQAVIDAMSWIGGKIKAVIKWLIEKFRPRPDLSGFDKNGSGFNWTDALDILIKLLIAAAVIALCMMLCRLWRQKPIVVATAETVVPDLTDEDVAADQLPEDEWLGLAGDLMAKGESRLALRALYLACLAHLGERKLLTISRAKSNREYQRELNRRARLMEELRAAFDQNVLAFERAWYGLHEVTRIVFDQVESNLQKIREC